MSSASFSEDHLVEQPANQLMQHELGWDVVNCYDEWTLLRKGPEGKDGLVSQLGCQSKRDVVLVSRLLPALQRLNSELPVVAIEGAVEELTRDRPALSLAEANREIDRLLKQGVKVSFFQHVLEKDPEIRLSGSEGRAGSAPRFYLDL